MTISSESPARQLRSSSKAMNQEKDISTGSPISTVREKPCSSWHKSERAVYFMLKNKKPFVRISSCDFRVGGDGSAQSLTEIVREMITRSHPIGDKITLVSSNAQQMV